MKSYFVCIAVAALWIAPAYGQNLIEHAAAAAGATIGTGAGKALSNGIDKILGRAAETGSTAGKPATVRPSPTTPVVAPAPTSNGATTVLQGPGSPTVAIGTSQPSPVQPGPAQHTRPRRSAAPVDPGKPVFAGPEVAAYTPAPVAIAPPPPPSPEDFAKLKEGSPREDVQAALGTPALLYPATMGT
jgi:hypothetical protein